MLGVRSRPSSSTYIINDMPAMNKALLEQFDVPLADKYLRSIECPTVRHGSNSHQTKAAPDLSGTVSVVVGFGRCGLGLALSHAHPSVPAPAAAAGAGGPGTCR